MEQKSILRQFPQLWRHCTVVFAAAIFLASCSTDEPGASEVGLVAVEFTATVGGVALPQGRSTNGAHTRGLAGTGADDPQTYTGTTSTGVPYRDFTDADGFETRAFYPGGASRQSEIVGASTGMAGGSAPGTRTANGGGSSPATRTTDGGDSWAATDKVGMFMVGTGGTLPGGILTVGGTTADNIEYSAAPSNPAPSATFTPTSTSVIYYPQDGSAVDFIAYYPYTGATGTSPGEIASNYKYHLTMDGQTDEGAQNGLDVLYAKADNGGTGYSKSKTPVNLQFGHVLSKVTLNITAGDGIDPDEIKSLPRSAVEFKGMPLTATLDLQNGAITAGSVGDFNPAKASASIGTAHATFTALVVPQAGTNTSRTVIITVNGLNYTWEIAAAESFLAGEHYSYPVTVSRNGITVGNPTITDWNKKDNPDGTGDAEIITPPFEGKLIKAGTFQMGSPDTEPNRYSDETQHEVTLTKDFFMMKYLVSNADYARFLNDSGVGQDRKMVVEGYGEQELFTLNIWWNVEWNTVTSSWQPVSGRENYPMIQVKWYGAKAYRRLGRR